MGHAAKDMWLRNHVLGLLDNIKSQQSQLHRTIEGCKIPAPLRKKLDKLNKQLQENESAFRSWAITYSEQANKHNEKRQSDDT